MPFAGGGNTQDYPKKLIKLRWTAEFEQEVVVPEDSVGSNELLEEYLGVSGDLDMPRNTPWVADSFKILSVEDLEPLEKGVK